MEVHPELGVLRKKDGEAIIGCTVRSCLKRQQKLSHFQSGCTFYSTHLTSKPPVTLLSVFLGTWIYTSQSSQPLSI